MYTVGQKARIGGIPSGSLPWYVVSKDPATNIVKVVSDDIIMIIIVLYCKVPGRYHPALYCYHIITQPPHWIYEERKGVWSCEAKCGSTADCCK